MALDTTTKPQTKGDESLGPCTLLECSPKIFNSNWREGKSKISTFLSCFFPFPWLARTSQAVGQIQSLEPVSFAWIYYMSTVPIIEKHPESCTVQLGKDCKLFCRVTGKNLKYRWYRRSKCLEREVTQYLLNSTRKVIFLTQTSALFSDVIYAPYKESRHEWRWSVLVHYFQWQGICDHVGNSWRHFSDFISQSQIAIADCAEWQHLRTKDTQLSLRLLIPYGGCLRTA